MTVTAVVGAQWGDEGKGRVIDWLARRAHLVIRFQGGDNAGHTVVNDFGTFQLHLVPSGIFFEDTVCLIGTGCVVNPQALLEEMDVVARAGVALDRLFVSERAQVVLPYHRLIDALEDQARGAAQIGTTKRGIGPAYADKAARSGLRIGDLLRPAYLRERLALALPVKNRLLQQHGQAPLALDPLVEQATAWGAALRERIVDPLPLVRDAVRGGRNVLLEGQLGVMRDLDWGTYPFVTSSNPTAAGAAVGAGVPPNAIDDVLGVVKAYTTAVGAGPFPVELLDEIGDRLRSVGREYGATTGRPRRCGWLDVVAVRHGAWLNGYGGLAVTKLDVLSGLKELRICVAYRLDGRTLDSVPDTADLERVEPVYETLPGWDEETREARRWDDLPANARAYLRRVEELVGVPIRLVSVGPERDELVVLTH